jgi:hypothetical protein
MTTDIVGFHCQGCGEQDLVAGEAIVIIIYVVEEQQRFGGCCALVSQLMSMNEWVDVHTFGVMDWRFFMSCHLGRSNSAGQGKAQATSASWQWGASRQWHHTQGG